MDCYKEMYCKLFNQITDVINELKTVQMETEELFVAREEEQKVLQIVAKDKNAD